MKPTPYIAMLVIAPLLVAASACAQTGTPNEISEVTAQVGTPTSITVPVDDIEAQFQAVEAARPAADRPVPAVPVTYRATIAGKETEVVKAGDTLLAGPDEFVDTTVVGDQNCHLVVIAMKANRTIYRHVDQFAHEAALAAALKEELADQPVHGPWLPTIDPATFIVADPGTPPDVPAIVARWYDPDHVAVNNSD